MGGEITFDGNAVFKEHATWIADEYGVRIRDQELKSRRAKVCNKALIHKACDRVAHARERVYHCRPAADASTLGIASSPYEVGRMGRFAWIRSPRFLISAVVVVVGFSLATGPHVERSYVIAGFSRDPFGSSMGEYGGKCFGKSWQYDESTTIYTSRPACERVVAQYT